MKSPLSRNLEMKIPICNGEYDLYPTFKETFAIVTENASILMKQKFIFFHDNLGLNVTNVAVTKENYKE